MSTWGAGNFDSDEARDYLGGFLEQLVEQIEETVAEDEAMIPDESDSVQMMCNVELLWLLAKSIGAVIPEANTVEEWKTRYLGIWDETIDELEPDEGFKEERRAVIVESFDRLIKLCEEQDKLEER